MKVNWKIQNNQQPVIFHTCTNWDGLELCHSRMLAGEIDEFVEQRHELNFPLFGNFYIEKQTATGEQTLNCGTVGGACLVPAGQPVSHCYWNEETEILYMKIDKLLIVNAAENLRLSKQVELIETFGLQDPLLMQFGLALLAESKTEEAEGRLYAESLVHSLALHLVRYYSTSDTIPETISIGGLSGSKLRRAKDFIIEHLENDLTLSEIANHVGLSPYHFARTFKKTTGLTPQQYLTRQRIERAKLLLAKSDLPIVEVGFRSGFKNQSHFTTLFRKFTKITPKLWRELKIA
jgi:AraC family transcriptional regulator